MWQREIPIPANGMVNFKSMTFRTTVALSFYKGFSYITEAEIKVQTIV